MAVRPGGIVSMRGGVGPRVVAVLIVFIMAVSAFAVAGAYGSSEALKRRITDIENPVKITRVSGADGEISRTWVAPYDGYFHQWLENNGLKGVTIYTYDITYAPPVTCSSAFITFSHADAFPTGTVQLGYFEFVAGHTYKWTFSPEGKVGSSAEYYWTLEQKVIPPVASFTLSYTGTVLNADATGSYDPDGTIVEYAWDWGDGATSFGQTASHQYWDFNGKRITLTVTDNDGLQASLSKGAFPPVPYFLYGFTRGSDGALLTGCLVTATNSRTGVSLNAISDGDGYYDVDLNRLLGGWVVGDSIALKATLGTLTGLRTFTITDPDLPYFQIDITLSGAGNLPPVASFTLSYMGTVLNADASASYDPDGTIVQYVWYWGDGAVSSGMKSSHQYASANGHSVKLSIRDDDGYYSSTTNSIYPPFPFVVYGYIYGPDGAPLAGCDVKLTNVWTGSSMTSLSDIDGFYQMDLSTIPYGWMVGDTIVVTATQGTMSGSGADVTATMSPPFVQVDISLSEAGLVAEAGTIQYLWGQDSVTLDGSGSQSSVGIASSVWTWTSAVGTHCSISGSIATFPSVWFFAYGNYTITLMVVDNNGKKATDTVSISWGFRLYVGERGVEGIITPSNGYFKLRIENHGMTSFDWTILDCSRTSPPYDVYHATVTFSSPDQLLISDAFWMSGDRWYQNEYVLTGPAGAYMTIFSFFVPS